MIFNYTEFIREFKETKSNTKTLYKDDNLVVKVVKTFLSCKEHGKDTDWCSNDKYGFYKHNLTANMYRFIFSDGYKLRLTWDYVPLDTSPDQYSGGTHWGSGGVLSRNKKVPYYYIRPRNEENPFFFEHRDYSYRNNMVNYIRQIPQEAIDIVKNYQKEKIKEKDRLVNIMYSEISKISVVDDIEHGGKDSECVIEYNHKRYNIEYYKRYVSIKTKYNSRKYDFYFTNKFMRDFKSEYAFYDTFDTIDKYLSDKLSEFKKRKKK